MNRGRLVGRPFFLVLRLAGIAFAGFSLSEQSGGTNIVTRCPGFLLNPIEQMHSSKAGAAPSKQAAGISGSPKESL
jgi:hypothetical protein